jgi:F-type H+-transporting ATPase subunit delta
MAELATIARPYADALFKASTQQGADLSSAVAWAEELAAIAANPQLRQLADNPKVTSEQVFEVITGVVRSALPDAARNFLRVVIDNGRVDALPEVAAQFHALINERSGVSDAVVYSAYPIEPAQMADVKATLEKRFERKLNATVVVQPELIGGIRVVVGDEVLDTSVKARLAQMKAALTA